MVSAFSAGVVLAVERPAINPRVTQADILSNSILQNRRDGLRIFSTPFNLLDGLGDGPLNPLDRVSPGGRPTVQNNGIFLRLNGNDSQTCLECHSVLSNLTIPAKFAAGGAGGISASAFPGVIDPDIDDSDNNGFADILGRFINPPALFGGGYIEALGREMTMELQALKTWAQANPGTVVSLDTKGVNFGTITFDSSIDTFDTSAVSGTSDDLVIRPFGRKGCCFSLRDFDKGALQFHHGMQPTEVVGDGVDEDGDGVADEIFVGELSAIHIFQAALEPPIQTRLSQEEKNGQNVFNAIGCAICHIPKLQTDSQYLPLAFPEIPEDPHANVYLQSNYSDPPAIGSGSTGNPAR